MVNKASAQETRMWHDMRSPMHEEVTPNYFDQCPVNYLEIYEDALGTMNCLWNCEDVRYRCNIICKNMNIQQISMEQQNIEKSNTKNDTFIQESNVHFPLQGGNLQQSRALLQ
jgi:hypothetical protein